jgi:tetratricopeptide (TPR) repeat protein
LFAFALSVTGAAVAEDDDASKNAARELAEQAAKAMEAEDYAKAQDLYQRAYALVRAPTLSLRHARALAKGGRWVEALEAYVRTTRTRVDASSPDAFREAVAQAQTELAELRPRVPRAIVAVKGIDRKSKELSVTIDGRPLAAVLLGVPAPLDPGKHELVAKTVDGREARATLELKEKLEWSCPSAGERQAQARAREPHGSARASGPRRRRSSGPSSLGAGGGWVKSTA